MALDETAVRGAEIRCDDAARRHPQFEMPTRYAGVVHRDVAFRTASDHRDRPGQQVAVLPDLDDRVTRCGTRRDRSGRPPFDRGFHLETARLQLALGREPYANGTQERVVLLRGVRGDRPRNLFGQRVLAPLGQAFAIPGGEIHREVVGTDGALTSHGRGVLVHRLLDRGRDLHGFELRMESAREDRGHGVFHASFELVECAHWTPP